MTATTKNQLYMNKNGHAVNVRNKKKDKKQKKKNRNE